VAHGRGGSCDAHAHGLLPSSVPGVLGLFFNFYIYSIVICGPGRGAMMSQQNPAGGLGLCLPKTTICISILNVSSEDAAGTHHFRFVF